jgi:hypothetical protein
MGHILTENSDFIKKIPDNKPVRIFLPIKDSEERIRLNCVFSQTEPPHFSLLFRPGDLPVHKIDLSTSVIINLDISGQSYSLEAKITGIINNQTLDLVPQKTINHEQLREYFRVDCTVPILLRSIIPEEFNVEESNWTISGTTVDLSGSGLRASFTKVPPENTQVRLELALPNTETTIVRTIASPVRISKLTEKLWDVAYQFDQIDDEDQDAIIGCCLVEQRRLLRLKVQVKGN